MAGDGPEFKGKIRVGDATLPMRISWGGGIKANTIHILGGKAEAVDDFLERAKSLASGDTLNLEFSLDYIYSNAQRALVRMAYLVLFHRLGYGYVFSEAARFIRDVISGACREELWRLLPQLGDVHREGTSAPVVLVPIGTDEITVLPIWW